MSPQDPNIGRELLGGQFQILQKIGIGGVGTVYKAAQPSMNRMVAVKIIHKKLRARDDIMSRFRREARALSHLTHPNTVRVLLYGALEDGSLYLVMEYLDGRNLRQVIRKEGPMPVERAIPIVIQVCGALQEAHSQGIIHRDLKPEDIVLTSSREQKDVPKVLDFGLAKVTERELAPGSIMLTQEGTTFGQPEYMSSEQAQGKVLDARSDIYSLAVILYEMLTGKLPFDARSPMERVQLHVTKPPIPLDERIPGKTFPPGLGAVIAKALEKRPENRYSSADELAQALNRFAIKRADGQLHEADQDAPKQGDVIDGKYKVERVLGAGGMGVVVAALDIVLGRKVAIKLILPGALEVPHAKERFLREARAAAAITSEHVVRILGVDTREDGMPYIVMEHLNGVDLGQLLASGPLPIQEAIDYVLQACEALAEAHTLGLVHRDIKPQNIFLCSPSQPGGSRVVKVLDFGLTKVMDEPAEGGAGSLTATKLVAGSPYYMSPEQVRSLKYVDARTDIWSIGVVLYELLTAKRPFEADTTTAILAKILTDPPPPMRSIRPEIPPTLEAVVVRCLQKRVTDRAQTLAELSSTLARFGSDASRASVERIANTRRGDRPVEEASYASQSNADTQALASTLGQTEPLDSARLKLT